MAVQRKPVFKTIPSQSIPSIELVPVRNKDTVFLPVLAQIQHRGRMQGSSAIIMPPLLETLKSCRLAVGLLAVLTFNLVFQMAVTSVVYTQYSQQFYFDSFLAISLMGWSLYFAWEAVVKENAYELLAYLCVVSLLNFHGIYMLSAHWTEGLTITTLIILPICLLLHFGLVLRAMQPYSRSHLAPFSKEPSRLQRAYQLLSSFQSFIKLDLCLASYIYACFFYYVVVYWTPVAAGVCTTASLGMILFIVHFAWGMLAAAKEHKAAFVIFLLALPVVIGIKLYFAIAVIISPNGRVDTLVLVHTCVFGRN